MAKNCNICRGLYHGCTDCGPTGTEAETCVKYDRISAPPTPAEHLEVVAALLKALEPMVTIYQAYQESNLDEHRPEWDPVALAAVIMVSGRGGKTLLTLADCEAAWKASGRST